jgi:hypothetical protein
MLSQDEIPGSCGLNNCQHSTQLIARQAAPAALTQDIVHWSGRRVAATRAQRLQFRIGGDRDRERPDRRGAC